MDDLGNLIPVAIIAVILVIGWVLLKVSLKLTATLFRIGCIIIFLIAAGGLALVFLIQ
jgi:hypothetical protein